MSANLIALALIYGQLSLLAFGGGNTILPEMQRQVVEVQGWMSAREFAALYALALAAPGPNMLVSTLIGWRVAGFAGAMVATLAMIVPAGILVLSVSSAWYCFRDARWRQIVQAAITPLTAGLVMAAALVLCEVTSSQFFYALITAVAALILWQTRLHPLWVLGAGAVLSAALGAGGLLG